MSQYLYLVLLVMTSYGLSRSRERLFGDSRDTYNKLMAGLMSWGLLLLLTSIADSEFVDKIPVLSDAQYRYPLEALLLVAGGTFIVSAIFTWLPHLIAARETNGELQSRVDFTMEMTRILKANSRDAHQLQHAVARLLKFTSVDMIRIARPNDENAISSESNLEYRLSRFYEVLAEGNYVFLSEGFGHHNSPVALLPIKVNEDEIEAILGLWPNAETVTDAVLDNLQITADVLMIGGFTSESSKNEETVGYETLFNSLRADLLDADNIADHIRLIYDRLRENIGFNILRIAIFDQRGFNVTQHCVGVGKSLLTDRDRSIGTQKTRLGLLFSEPQLTFCSDLSNSAYEDDRWLASCGARCALTIPLISNNSVIAALTLASDSESLSKELGEKIAPALTETLLPLVKLDLLAHQLVTYNRQILNLTGALKTVASGGEPTTMLQELLELLVKKVPTTYCRLWRLNADTDSLEFVADSRSREIEGQTAPQTLIPLDRVHWHKQAVLTGRVMVINQRETRTQMDEDEESLALIAGTRSALIIPLTSGSKTIGVISLAELRCWERNHFSLSETLFSRAVANIIAQVLASIINGEETQLLRRQVSTMQHRNHVGDLFAELPMRISTPLTSIMARTDQLISSVAVKDEAASVHLLAIKRQTEKIVTEVRNIQDTRRGLQTTTY